MCASLISLICFSFFRYFFLFYAKINRLLIFIHFYRTRLLFIYLLPGSKIFHRHFPNGVPQAPSNKFSPASFFNCYAIIVVQNFYTSNYYYYFTLCKVFTPELFHWSLNDSKSHQISRTLLSILE